MKPDRVEQLAYIMELLYTLGYTKEEIARGVDAWWKVKGPRNE